MRAKICGITHLEDALCAVHNGAWAIGFNFYQQSPRYIPFEKARKISAQLPEHVVKVGILIDYSEKEILHSFEFLNLIQVYQHNISLLLDKKRVILALQALSKDECPPSAILQEYGYICLDAPRQQDGLLGGTGRLARWDLARELAQDYRLILAGGLNNTNLEDAMKQVQPFAVDVASGIEISPGIKDPTAVKEFLMRCHYVS